MQKMKIILLEKVLGLGNLGDIVAVCAGYARNFLIPKRKARRATPVVIAEFEAQRAELEKIAADKLALAKEHYDKMSSLGVRIAQKASVDGRLFGSVTAFNIAEALNKQGFAVKKTQIRLPHGPLKQLGEHPISIDLHTDVVADIMVTILGEHA